MDYKVSFVPTVSQPSNLLLVTSVPDTTPDSSNYSRDSSNLIWWAVMGSIIGRLIFH